MKFQQFKIKNFKGIEDITIDLAKSPDANIYTLVGLNESGKTTILEALNFFNREIKGIAALGIPGGTIKDHDALIPISLRDNFNGSIEITATLLLERDDFKKINDFITGVSNIEQLLLTNKIIYYRYYHFKNSNFQKAEYKWSGFSGKIKGGEKNEYRHIGQPDFVDENIKLAEFCSKLIPSILYFPNFLFDFPPKIALESKVSQAAKEIFYFELIQDILNSLNNETNIEEHLIKRIKNNDKRSLDRLIQLMSKKVTEVVFGAWNRIFGRSINDTRIVISYSLNDEGLCCLEFGIESEDGIYQISERSLGFRWFFIFLLFTQFRPFRKGEPQNVIFLFDEPASNLHSSAQKQLLSSFENLTQNSKVIYTTHSQYMINPKWLESTYVVKNAGLDLSDTDRYNVKKTKITIERYREFAAKHPYNTAYFQPILDVLDYSPSDLETIPNCAFLEGKNDFYTLVYFKEIILKTTVDLNLSPSTGSSNLDTLISLYIGWGKEFIVLLDSDTAGKEQKDRYIDKFGTLVEKRIFTLTDIDSNWNDIVMEKLFSDSELVGFQQKCYPETTTYNKTHFNRSVQESLMKKEDFEFSDETKNNFDKVLKFLKSKLEG
ncbi:MAG: ATP-dependent nuclease [Bacteroidota bacterium]